jgi:YfiR/HmsC-like
MRRGVGSRRSYGASHCRQRPSALRSASWFLLALASGAFFCPIGAAQNQPGEYEVKAAFLFNFTEFVEWPDGSFEDSHSPIVIGIIGEDPFGDSLTRIVAGQKAQGRAILIVKYRRSDDLRRCHVLFISASERQRTAQILAGVQNAGVLTVSDLDGFAAAGGIMQFVMQESRVRFVVNLDAATQNKLRVSAKLLALAQVVNHSEAAR